MLTEHDINLLKKKEKTMISHKQKELDILNKK